MTRTLDELKSESERLNAVLSGYDNHLGSLIGINQMYSSMLKWKEEVENITLKFEDLVGHRGGGSNENQILSIHNLIDYLDLVSEFDNEKVSNIAKNSFGVSGTFRKGKIGAWKDFFSHSDKELYKSKIGDLLIDIGYESDKNW